MSKHVCNCSECHTMVEVTDPDGAIVCDTCEDAGCDPFGQAECCALREAVEAAQDDNTGCPQCGGPGVVLGSLGSRVIFRCRNCGWEF